MAEQSIFLTDSEIAEACKGLRQPAAMCRFLSKLGFRVARRPDGKPLVWREQPANIPYDGIRWTR